MREGTGTQSMVEPDSRNPEALSGPLREPREPTNPHTGFQTPSRKDCLITLNEPSVASIATTIVHRLHTGTQRTTRLVSIKVSRGETNRSKAYCRLPDSRRSVGRCNSQLGTLLPPRNVNLLLIASRCNSRGFCTFSIELGFH